MSKNVIHNFNLSIQNSTDIKSSEHLTETVLKELAKVSKEMSQQKDIVQLWQEHNNAAVVSNDSITSTYGGTVDILAGANKNPLASANNTSSDLEGTQDSIVSTGTLQSSLFNTSTTTPIEGGVSDNTLRTEISSSASVGITPSVMGEQDLTNQIYTGISAQQSLIVPESLQTNDNEPSVEVIKAEIKKKLNDAVMANDSEGIKYWTAVSKAFDEGATIFDFDGKPDHVLFSQMYADLKQLNSSNMTVQNFKWEIVREKMIKAIDVNILNGKISKESNERWTKIRKELNDDKTNLANLFERYDELFLLLKEVEGLDNLPTTITIITKTKIYPNLSADKLYAEIGKEAIYGRLRQVHETNLDGSGVNKGAVKIKNTNQTSFIIGESLAFFVDEAFINQKENQKENIKWVVYNSDTKKENIFKNEGTSFSYNFDKPGTYRIDAYGKNHTVKQKKTAKTATFIELKIIAQEIVIAPPANAAGEFIRPFAEEKNFKISLKNNAVKTLNPLKLYYNVETTTANKITKTSDEQELDPSGSIKLSMLDLGTYKIKVFSKDQYALVKEFKTSVIKNEVTRIGVKDASNKNVFLLGDSSSSLTLEVKSYKINPPTEKEKEDVKWMIYDSNSKPYIPNGELINNEDKDSKKPFIHKWNFFPVTIPQKSGSYTIEAYYDSKKGPKSGVVYKIEVKQPEVTEACWVWSGGSKKITSGFSGESNYIKAQIPYYENQTVRIYFYLNNAKTNHYIDVKTNGKGEIFEEVKFNAVFQKAIGFKGAKTAKVGFKLLGIQNSKPYLFNTPANYDSDSVLSVTTDTKILDVYFMYDGIRVNPFTQVPYGAKINGVIKTLNMVGHEVVLKVRRKNAQHSQLKMKTIVKNEGEASITFVLDKKWRPITPLFGVADSYYLEMEGIKSEFYLENGLNAVVGDFVKPIKNMEIIFPLLEKPINDTNSKWGRNYNWTDDDGRNQATFDSNRDSGNRKHAARDLYTEPKTLVVAIADGKVLEARSFYAGTHQVTVLHKLKDGRKFIARYGELDSDSITVKKGDIIKQKTVIGRTGKLQGKSVIAGQDIYMLHFEIFSAEKGENLNSPLTDKFNGSPFQRRKDLLDSIDILLEGYKNTFETNKEDRKEVNSLTISEKGKQFIKDWELFKKKMYDNDGDINSKGNCTIGYGHKIHDGQCDGRSSEDKFKNGISENEASKLFDNDILIFEKAIRNKIKMPLYQYEFDALVSYVYNIGPAFEAPNLIRYINSKDYTSAIHEIETGSQNTKRRKQERDMFSKGIYDSAH